MPKVAIGFITYEEATAKYLPEFLKSLQEQTFSDYQISAIDNSEQADNANQQFIKTNYPAIDLVYANANLGFAKAYNRLIARAVDYQAEYFFIINPDTILEPNVLEKLINTLKANQQIGAVSPKVFCWDFSNSRRTTIIDSCGLIEPTALRFVDLGAGASDRGQFDYRSILGPSGCAGLWRLSALVDIKINDQYFDERFFMYKEDCDLAKRLQLAGWQAVIVPSAVVYHARSVKSAGREFWKILANRKNKSLAVNSQSFFGQEILFYKYWPIQNWQQRLSIAIYRWLSLSYAFFMEKSLLDAYRRAKSLRPGLKAERGLIKIKSRNTQHITSDI